MQVVITIRTELGQQNNPGQYHAYMHYVYVSFCLIIDIETVFLFNQVGTVVVRLVLSCTALQRVTNYTLAVRSDP